MNFKNPIVEKIEIQRAEDVGGENVSRYIKPRWVKNGSLSTEAFDLRQGPPQEEYVSFFSVIGIVKDELFKSAYDILSKKIRTCDSGSIILLDVSEVLEEINGDDDPVIEFVAKILPHYGLVYKTPEQEKILEIKGELRIIAQKK